MYETLTHNMIIQRGKNN